MLSAECTFSPDAELQSAFARCEGVIITQGFIARNAAGETVLLGRGGSDTSAAYFAAKLQAKRCEIWTDVPGMFTADPRQVPTARVLRALDYNEAQEVATMGAKDTASWELWPAHALEQVWEVAPAVRSEVVFQARSAPAPALEAAAVEERSERTADPPVPEEASWSRFGPEKCTFLFEGEKTCVACVCVWHERVHGQLLHSITYSFLFCTQHNEFCLCSRFSDQTFTAKHHHPPHHLAKLSTVHWQLFIVFWRCVLNLV